MLSCSFRITLFAAGTFFESRFNHYLVGKHFQENGLQCKKNWSELKQITLNETAKVILIFFY